VFLCWQNAQNFFDGDFDGDAYSNWWCSDNVFTNAYSLKRHPEKLVDSVSIIFSLSSKDSPAAYSLKKPKVQATTCIRTAIGNPRTGPCNTLREK
jgi:hypothetical protein